MVTIYRGMVLWSLRTSYLLHLVLLKLGTPCSDANQSRLLIIITRTTKTAKAKQQVLRVGVSRGRNAAEHSSSGSVTLAQFLWISDAEDVQFIVELKSLYTVTVAGSDMQSYWLVEASHTLACHKLIVIVGHTAIQ